MARKRKTWVGRVYLGDGRYHWVGRFATKRERDDAVAKARTERPWEAAEERAELTCAEWADWYQARIERDQKSSSADASRQRLRRFKADLGD